jgi:fucose permease
MATNLAIGQVFCSNLANNTALLGLFQGSYGIGGIAGPLIATALVSRGYLWSRYYMLQLGLATFNLVFSAWSFWNYELESDSLEPEQVISRQQEPESTSSRAQRRWQSFKTLVSNRPTLLGACFIFAYQGAEVAISGWIISFLVQFRHGDPSKVGFVTSGFWAGITVGEAFIPPPLYESPLNYAGRFTLSFLAHKIGERRFVFVVTIGVCSSTSLLNQASNPIGPNTRTPHLVRALHPG